LQQATLADLPTEPDVSAKTVKEVEDLVLTLDVAPANAEHASMLKIDLDLLEQNQEDAHTKTEAEAAAKPSDTATPAPAQAESAPEPEPAQTETVVSHETARPVTATANDSKTVLGVDSEWLADREHAESQIMQLLDKHTQMLDFLSLNSQQISHLQSLPAPTDALLQEVIQRQSELTQQLEAVKAQLSQAPEAAVIKLPDEFKLSLEKQKIELQKYFSQNIAQNSANVEAANQETLASIQAMLAENTQSAKTLESNLAPLSQSVNELKTKLQAISKKVDEAATKTAKVAKSSQDDTEGSGGFIIFVIGLLCGLTVVLSSLAIYNFLSRDAAPSAKTSHDATSAEADAGHEKPAHGDAGHEAPVHDAPAHGEPSHGAPAKEDGGHGASSSHDKPASDSSKPKSH
jgi:DNA repair exonuclease SbcCD ATPase subunit